MAHPLARRTPSRPGPRLLCLGLALILSGSILVTSAYGDSTNSLKKKQHHVHSQVRSAKGDLDGSSKQLRHAQARLAAAKHQLRAAKASLHKTRVHLRKARAVAKRLRAQLAAARTALAKAQAAERAAEAAVAEQRREIGVFAARNYMDGDPQLLGISTVLRGGSFEDVTAQVNAAHSIATKQQAELARLHAAEVALAGRRQEAQELEATVASKEQAAAVNLTAKKRLEQRALADKRRVARLVAGRAAAKRAAARIRAHDLRQLKALRHKEAQIKQEILARSARQRNRTVHDMGGLLFRPVPGYITSPYGWRKHPIYGYWGLHDGDDFHAPCGTPERAAGTGKVISEYYSSVWGNRLYLDLGKINGHNFTVIYNHINKYAVGSGATVVRGQTVAYAGTTGWSTGCHLHFTVMRDGTAVNPMDYM